MATFRPPKSSASDVRLRITDPEIPQPHAKRKRRRDPTIVFEGNRIGNKFRLIRQLGDGGMGKVWLAEHLGLRRAVAVKVLHKQVHADEAHRARFAREAVAIGTLSHPGIVDALDFGELEDGRNFLAMEYVVGETLDAIGRRTGPFMWRHALRIGIEVADALAFAHDNGVIHRDLKPDNLIVEGGDLETGRVRILDLGLARIDHDGVARVSEAEIAIGTASYSSPEQLRGEATDARADVYGVGAVLYRLITGEPPYPCAHLHEVATRERELDLRAPREIVPDRTRPSALDALILECLSHDPEDRPASAAELRDRLRALGKGRFERSTLIRAAAGLGLVSVGIALGILGAIALMS